MLCKCEQATLSVCVLDFFSFCMSLLVLCCVCVKACGHVFYALCVVRACAVNKGSVEWWFLTHDFQAPRIPQLPWITTKCSSSVWVGTGWYWRPRKTRHHCLDPISSHLQLTKTYIQINPVQKNYWYKISVKVYWSTENMAPEMTHVFISTICSPTVS